MNRLDQAELERKLESQVVYNISRVNLQDKDQETSHRELEKQGLCYGITQQEPREKGQEHRDPPPDHFEQELLSKEVSERITNVRLILDTMDATLAATGRNCKDDQVPFDEMPTEAESLDPEPSGFIQCFLPRRQTPTDESSEYQFSEALMTTKTESSDGLLSEALMATRTESSEYQFSEALTTTRSDYDDDEESSQEKTSIENDGRIDEDTVGNEKCESSDNRVQMGTEEIKQVSTEEQCECQLPEAGMTNISVHKNEGPSQESSNEFEERQEDEATEDEKREAVLDNEVQMENEGIEQVLTVTSTSEDQPSEAPTEIMTNCNDGDDDDDDDDDDVEEKDDEDEQQQQQQQEKLHDKVLIESGERLEEETTEDEKCESVLDSEVQAGKHKIEHESTVKTNESQVSETPMEKTLDLDDKERSEEEVPIESDERLEGEEKSGNEKFERVGGEVQTEEEEIERALTAESSEGQLSEAPIETISDYSDKEASEEEVSIETTENEKCKPVTDDVQIEKEGPIFLGDFKDELSSLMKSSTELLSESEKLREKVTDTDTDSEDLEQAQDATGLLSELQLQKASFGSETEVCFQNQAPLPEEVSKDQIVPEKEAVYDMLEQELSRSMRGSTELSGEIQKLREENAHLQQKSQGETQTLLNRIESLERELSDTDLGDVIWDMQHEVEQITDVKSEAQGNEEIKSRNLLAHLDTKIDMELKLADMQKKALKYKKSLLHVEKQMEEAKAEHEVTRDQLKNEEIRLRELRAGQEERDKENKRLRILLEDQEKTTNAIKATLAEVKVDAINYKGSSEKAEKELMALKKDQEEKGQKAEQLLSQVKEQSNTENVLKTMLEESQEKVFQYKSSIDAAEKELSIFKKDQEEKGQMIEQLRTEVEEKKKALSDFETRLKASQKEAVEYESSYEETRTTLYELKEESTHLRFKVDEQEEVIKELEVNLADTTNDATNTKLRLSEIVEDKKKKDEAYDELYSQLKSQRSIMDSIESKLVDSQDEALKYKHASEQAEAQIKELKIEQKDEKQKTEQLLIKLKGKERAVTGFKVRMIDLQDEASEVKSFHEEAEKKLSKLREEKAQLFVQLDEEKQTLTHTENQLADAKKESLKWKNLNEQIEIELASLREEYEKNQKDSKNLRIKLDEQVKVMIQINTRLSRAEHEVVEHKKLCEQAEEKLMQFKEEEEGKDKTIAQLSTELEEQNKALAKAEAIAEEIKNQTLKHEELNAEAKKAKEAQKETDENNSLLSAQLEEQNADLVEMRAKLEDAIQEILKYQEHTATLELAALKKEYKGEENKIEQLFTDLKDKKSVIRDMEMKLKEATDEAAKYKTSCEEAKRNASELESRNLVVEGQLSTELKGQKIAMSGMETTLKKATREALHYKTLYEETERKRIESETRDLAAKQHRQAFEERESKNTYELEKALHVSQSRREQVEQHAEGLQKQLLGLEKSLDDANEKNAALQRQVDITLPQFQSNLEKRMVQMEEEYEQKTKTMEQDRLRYGSHVESQLTVMQEKYNKKIKELGRSLKKSQDKNVELAISVSMYKSSYDENGQLESKLAELEEKHQKKIRKLEKSIADYQDSYFTVEKRERALTEELNNQSYALKRNKALERELMKAKAQVLFWYQKSNPRARFLPATPEVEEEQFIYDYE